MKDKIDALAQQFDAELANAQDTKTIEDLRVRYLGRKSPVQDLMKGLKDCSPDDRPRLGKWINDLKESISSSLTSRKATLQTQELDIKLSQETLDITEPGRRKTKGRQHPLSQMLDETCQTLESLGFSIHYSPEVESEYYNYWGLNFPPDHPALDMQDTFYLSPDKLLRSHTTNIQQRMMEKTEPPIRIASPGKCYRNETITSRSHVLFHQVDVLYIDKGVNMGDLLATLEAFYSTLFNQKVTMRTRASYFPFVEPGIEVDIQCTACSGKGCPLCKHTGWLEVCGAGLVHPEVLKQGGLDPDVYSGFAWGGGVERLYMLRHGVSDIRHFTNNNLRFLNQF